jgi:hypothetical protein
VDVAALRASRPARLLFSFGALMVLASYASHRGAPLLGEALGASLGRLAAPSKRRVRDVYGVPPDGLPEGHTHDPSAPLPPHAGPSSDGSQVHELAPPVAPVPPPRSRGVYVPASVVLAYAKRGTVPAADGPRGVVLRGVSAGTGLADGDVVVRMGRAPVHSVREISSIVTAALFAGHTHVSGTVLRDGEEIDVTVEIPTGADAGP